MIATIYIIIMLGYIGIVGPGIFNYLIIFFCVAFGMLLWLE